MIAITPGACRKHINVCEYALRIAHGGNCYLRSVILSYRSKQYEHILCTFFGTYLRYLENRNSVLVPIVHTLLHVLAAYIMSLGAGKVACLSTTVLEVPRSHHSAELATGTCLQPLLCHRVVSAENSSL